ncbi:MAG: hypothetical protein MSC31_06725 [Solirubrobacteraceae bacterium MAG38_C4-C5]|nr:hypothetical protein [Candidatus Siliceabacter maunaloa]
MTARALTLFLAVMAVAGVLRVEDAFACSCAFQEADEKVADADAAFEGKVIGTTDAPDNGPVDEVDVRFAVERVFKGPLGEQVTVRTSVSGSSCDLGPLEPGTRIALTLSRDEEGRWQGFTCSQFDPDDLDDPGSRPPPSLEPATLAQLARPSPVSAWADIAVWSAYDAGIDAYRLTALVGAEVRTLPVDPSPVPFDADVGPDRDSNPAVVYSRCATAPEPPADRTSADCDLFIVAIPDGRERPIRNANSAGSEFSPTLWGGKVAWARTYEGRPDEPFVYTRPLVAPRERASQRLPGVPTRRCSVQTTTEPGPRASCATMNRRIDDLELYGRRLALDVNYSVEDQAGFVTREVRLDDVRDKTARLVALGVSGEGGQDHIGLSIDAGRLSWYRTCFGDPGGCTSNAGSFRYRIATGDYERDEERTQLAGYSWLQGGSYRVRNEELTDCDEVARPDRPDATCPVLRTGPLDWRPIDADRVR